MKRYVNCYPDGALHFYTTARSAKEWAGVGAHAVAVEIELPDPPHNIFPEGDAS